MGGGFLGLFGGVVRRRCACGLALCGMGLMRVGDGEDVKGGRIRERMCGFIGTFDATLDRAALF